MTKDEQTIANLKKLKSVHNGSYGADIDRAIKAIEQQEFILDKIRAEIWDLQYGDEEKSMTDEDRADAYNNAITQVIDIIDKYKAESEGER